jgi:uncharacterized SAM-binding protein YcdF (DUF218 family)
MQAFVKALLLPPSGLLLAAVAGLLVMNRWPRFGRRLCAVAVGLLYVLSTPLFGNASLSLLEEPYVDPLVRGTADAIVALGGGSAGMAAEYGADAVNAISMARLRYAAHLQRRAGKPLLLSGGSVSGDTTAESQQMLAVLATEMHVPVQWTEERSVDTYTNALESRRILAPLGIRRIYLVTHAWHMPRARLAFEHAGFAVVPAPTDFHEADYRKIRPADFLPQAAGLLKSYYFFHEVLGYLVYSVRIRL